MSAGEAREGGPGTNRLEPSGAAAEPGDAREPVTAEPDLRAGGPQVPNPIETETTGGLLGGGAGSDASVAVSRDGRGLAAPAERGADAGPEHAVMGDVGASAVVPAGADAVPGVGGEEAPNGVRAADRQSDDRQLDDRQPGDQQLGEQRPGEQRPGDRRPPGAWADGAMGANTGSAGEPNGGADDAPGLAGDRDARLAEALVFASSEPVREAAVAELLLAHGSGAEPLDARAVLQRVQAHFAGSGVVLVEVANGWQFRTAPDLVPALTTVLERPRRLPRVAMETLAIVAYHQPCTRTEIEAIRGVSLGQQTLDQLLENGLIVPRGRKEVPGRPILWGTSPQFLERFGLAGLRDLPRREELLMELPGAANPPSGSSADPASAAVSEPASGHENGADG